MHAIRLCSGAGNAVNTACWMTAISMYAERPDWSDQPLCVPSTLRTICIWANDWMTPDERTRWIVPNLFEPMGAPNDLCHEQTRALLCADYAVRRFAPIALRAAGHNDLALQLESLPPITTHTAADAAADAARAADTATAAARAADTATDAAAYAARAADTATDAAAYAAARATYAAARAAHAAADAARAAADAARGEICSLVIELVLKMSAVGRDPASIEPDPSKVANLVLALRPHHTKETSNGVAQPAACFLP